MKKCPKCGKELKTKVLGSIDVDECESCKGVWLDVGELGKAEEAADPNINWLDFEIWKHPEKFKSKETGPQMSFMCLEHDQYRVRAHGGRNKLLPGLPGDMARKGRAAQNHRVPRRRNIENNIFGLPPRKYPGGQRGRDRTRIPHVGVERPVFHIEIDAVQALRREAETDRNPDRPEYTQSV